MSEPTTYALAILHGLQSKPNVYQGQATETDAGIQRVLRRRKRNRVARRQRRVNRQRSS